MKRCDAQSRTAYRGPANDTTTGTAVIWVTDDAGSSNIYCFVGARRLLSEDGPRPGPDHERRFVFSECRVGAIGVEISDRVDAWLEWKGRDRRGDGCRASIHTWICPFAIAPFLFSVLVLISMPNSIQLPQIRMAQLFFIRFGLWQQHLKAPCLRH